MHAPRRIPGMREHPDVYKGLLPESQGQNMALTVLYVPYSLDIGMEASDTGGESTWPVAKLQERGGLAMSPIQA